MNTLDDLHNRISRLKSQGETFAIATVVRTVSVTAAKAGAKAVIGMNGTIIDGWIGGGCAKSAVIKAAKQTMETGQPRLVSLLPEDLIKDAENQPGVNVATNMCPSQGTMDIFVEPVVPPPHLFVFGKSPVAEALAEIASRFGFQCDTISEFGVEELNDRSNRNTYVVVATQGSGDIKALEQALQMEAEYVAFVGSRKKVASLRQRLDNSPDTKARFDKLKAPAGLDLGAITPDEIALSIVAEMVSVRRQGQRTS